MYRKICLLALILTLTGLVCWFLIPTPVASDKAPTEAISATSTATTTEPVEPIETPIEKPKPLPPIKGNGYTIPEGLNPHTLQVLTDLIHCESRGNPNALNKVDRDGTSSYGLLQFKPSTFHGAVKLIEPEMTYEEAFASIYDGDLQIRAFIAWYADGKPISWWRQQFPACSQLYGYWLE